jgi:hypothetical protein
LLPSGLSLVFFERNDSPYSSAQGSSQEKIALLAEVDRSYVGWIERGDNNAAALTLSMNG